VKELADHGCAARRWAFPRLAGLLVVLSAHPFSAFAQAGSMDDVDGRPNPLSTTLTEDECTTPTPIPTPFPTSYPTLTAPALIDAQFTLPAYDGRGHWLGEGDSIQEEVDTAAPDDRIILDAERFVETVELTTSGLLIEAVPGRDVRWVGQDSSSPFNQPDGQPALIVFRATDTLIRGIELFGGHGVSFIGDFLGFPGGNGGPGLRVEESAVQLMDVQMSGGSGGTGSHTDVPRCNSHFWAGGGDGSVALRGSGANRRSGQTPPAHLPVDAAAKAVAPNMFFSTNAAGCWEHLTGMPLHQPVCRRMKHCNGWSLSTCRVRLRKTRS